VPAEYAPWPTIYGLFRRWQRDGTWDRILAALQASADAHGRIDWTVGVDSMTMHQPRQPWLSALARDQGLHPSKKDQDAHRKAKGPRCGRPPKLDPQLYRLRHAVENSIARLKRHRGIATCYDKLAVRFQAVLTITIISEWL
jgi:transposase